jgi:hypothetical protein
MIAHFVVTVLRWPFRGITSEAAVKAGSWRTPHVLAFHLASVALRRPARAAGQRDERAPPTASWASGGGTVGIALAGALVDRLGTANLFLFEARWLRRRGPALALRRMRE